MVRRMRGKTYVSKKNYRIFRNMNGNPRLFNCRVSSRDLFDGVDFSYNDEGRLVNVVGVPYGNRSMVLSYYPNGKIKRITNTEKGTVDFYWTD